VKRIPVAIVFLAFGPVLGMTGCAEEEPESCLPSVSIEATPPLLSSGDMLQLTVDVRDLTLVPPGDEGAGDLGKNCEGHFKVHLDSAHEAALQESIEELLVFPITADAGEHELIVRLYDPSDVPLIPEVRDTATLTFQ
jgi:hypothetical protein